MKAGDRSMLTEVIFPGRHCGRADVAQRRRWCRHVGPSVTNTMLAICARYVNLALEPRRPISHAGGTQTDARTAPSIRTRRPPVWICGRREEAPPTAPQGLVSRVTAVQKAQCNCTRDEGKLPQAATVKATVVNVQKSRDVIPSGMLEGGEQPNRCGSVERRLSDVRTGG